MFDTPQNTLTALRRVGYLTDHKTATTVFLAGKIGKPILLEGPAGAGKTELAQSIAMAAGVPLIRLQCYPGIDEEKAIGQFDRSLQDLYVLLMSKQSQTQDWDEIKREVVSRSFFLAGPLLAAIEQETRCVLLIDEIDKVDYAFEALLLELLSAWTLSIPKLGTIAATTIPFVVMTSNQERRLGDPLRRRSFYLVVEHPTAGREAAIVRNRTPHATPATHRFIAGMAKSLRAYTLEKPPSISEMNDIALAMELLGLEEIRAEHKDIVLPLIAKTEGDRKRLLMKQSFENIVFIAWKARGGDGCSRGRPEHRRSGGSDGPMKPPPFILAALVFMFMLFAIESAFGQPGNTPSEALYYANAYADHYHVPRELVHAIIAQESGWRRTAISEKGAVGLMQLMPGTAQRFGVRDRNSVSDNIGGGVRYLAALLREFSGDLRLVVAAYYCGERPLAMRGLNYSNADVVAYVKAVRRRYLKEIELHSMKNPDTTLQKGNRP